MLRHLSFQILFISNRNTKVVQTLSNFYVHNRHFQRERDFYDEDDTTQSSNERTFSDYSDSKPSFRQRSYRKFDDNAFKKYPRSTFDSRLRNYYNDGEGNLQSYTKKFETNLLGYNLKKPNFDDLQPIEKNFYVEHPAVTERTKETTESSRHQWNMKVNGSDVPKPILDFNELCLPDNLKSIILNQDYSAPTPIQAQGWPTVLSGRDMVGISQTGSGKTLVFALPAVIHATNQNRVKSKSRSNPQILVLAPTRELVQQILEVTTKFSDAVGLASAAAYGGASKTVQMRYLRGADICVATPGRLIDFVSEGFMSLQNCTYLVLDEADRMLDMGFEPQIRKIVDQIRPDRQTLMWSATWPKEIRALAEDFLDNYVQVTVGGGQLMANPNIEQNIYIMEDEEKLDRLTELLRSISQERKSKVLVFAAMKKTVDYIAQNLYHKGISALTIHGDVSQTRRDEVLRAFRTQKSCVLIATDVAARGLDITDTQHVINYDLPTNIEDYIHRIGRTARGVSSGVSHSFFTEINTGLAKDLIDVLERANQPVSKELRSIVNEVRFKNRSPPSYQKRNFQSRNFRRQHQFAYL